MKNKKIIYLALLLSFLLTGCNINSNNPDFTQAGNTSYSESDTYTETAAQPTDSPENSSGVITVPSDTSAKGTDNTGDNTTNSTSEITSENVTETETAVSTPQPATDMPETQAPPVVTQPPVVATTTTTTTTSAPPAPPAEPSPPTIHNTTADGVLTFSSSSGVIDYSNSGDGYVMAKYTGSNTVVKVQVTNPDGTNQVYTINTKGNYEAIPLTNGNGEYSILVCEAVGSMFAPVVTGKVNVSLSNSLAPFLRPSSYVPFSYGDSAVTKSSQLCGGTSTVLEKVDRVYSWLVDNVTYDSALAATVKKGYICDSEKVINKRIGICLDFAGTMAAMLRSQDIPTQLVVGNVSGSTALHAWVNVYVTDVGWVYGAIYFDGTAWHRMDPTFAAGSKSSAAIIQYIGDGSNYIAKNLY